MNFTFDLRFHIHFIWPWISHSILDFTFDPDLSLNPESHIQPGISHSTHIQLRISHSTLNFTFNRWFYLQPWILHLLLNFPIQLSIGYLTLNFTFKSQLAYHAQGTEFLYSTGGCIGCPQAVNPWKPLVFYIKSLEKSRSFRLVEWLELCFINDLKC